MAFTKASNAAAIEKHSRLGKQDLLLCVTGRKPYFNCWVVLKVVLY